MKYMVMRKFLVLERVRVLNLEVVSLRFCMKEVGIVVIMVVCVLIVIFIIFVVVIFFIDLILLVLLWYIIFWVRENWKLECVEKFGEGLVLGLEDVVVVRDGSLVVVI